jgi:hypothetical protein
MSCRRVCRELIERFRFGELDGRSAPHLAHLEVCAACRDEVGVDQLFVRHLRRALQARVDGYAPSPQAWDGVRARAVATSAESSRWRMPRLIPFVRTMRTLAAGSALVLAVVLTRVGVDVVELGADRPSQLPAAALGAPIREPLQWASVPREPRLRIIGRMAAVPSQLMPWPAGETPFAEIVTIRRVGTPPAFPSGGGFIR